MISFNTKKYMIMVAFLSILVFLISMYDINELFNGFNIPRRTSSLETFYFLQSSFSKSSLIFYSIIPFIYSYQYIEAKNNGFQNMIITRLKSSYTFLVKILISNAFFVGITFLILKGVQLSICTFLINPINLNDNTSLVDKIPYTLSINPLLNLIMYFSLSILGEIVFSILVLIVGLYLRNNLLYLGSGLFLSLIGVMIPPIINGILELKASFFMNAISLETLITPGFTTIGAYAPHYGAWSSYGVSLAIYSIIGIGLYLYWDLNVKEL